MRIACTVTNDLLQDQRMHRICSSLQAAGHQVVLVGRLKKNSQPLPQRPYQQHRLPMFFQRGKLFYLEYNLRLWRYLRKQRFEAINSVDLDSLLAGYLAKQKTSFWVFDAHEYFSETPEVVGRPLVRWLWRRLAHWLIPKTSARYTVGEALANIFSAEYGLAFGVVRNLPLRKALPAYQPSSQQQPKVILYQGMLNEGRGIENMIEAMRLLPDGFQLCLLGDGDLLDGSRKTGTACRSSADLEAVHKIVFRGFIPPEALPTLTREAWLGINLLDAKSPSYYFSLANKCFDYIQAGLPSLQMDFPEYQGLQTQYGCFVLVPHLAPELLAQTILQLANDTPRYEKLRQNCYQAAEILCWEQEEEKLLKMWDLR